MKILQKGQTLIEVLVALSVIVLIVTSITIAVVSSLNNAEFVKNQSLATQYAQQGMEIVRFMRNTNYGTFVGLTGNYCLADTCSAISPGSPSCGAGVSCQPNVNNIFVRSVNFDNSVGGSNPCGTLGTGVTSVVSWADNKCTSRTDPYCHKVQLFSCFSGGDIIPAPN